MTLAFGASTARWASDGTDRLAAADSARSDPRWGGAFGHQRGRKQPHGHGRRHPGREARQKASAQPASDADGAKLRAHSRQHDRELCRLVLIGTYVMVARLVRQRAARPGGWVVVSSGGGSRTRARGTQRLQGLLPSCACGGADLLHSARM
jgi:hypothetical protein